MATKKKITAKKYEKTARKKINKLMIKALEERKKSGRVSSKTHNAKSDAEFGLFVAKDVQRKEKAKKESMKKKALTISKTAKKKSSKKK